MNVGEACTRTVPSCTEETSLAEAGRLLRESEVDCLPVVSDVGKLVGLVSDRDLFEALSLAGRPAEDVPVRSALRPILQSCRGTDGVRDALRIMRTQGTRLLPVVDGAGVLQGMVSLDDLALAARPEGAAGPGDITDEDVVLALKLIQQRKSAPQQAAPENRSKIWI
jgi:CBS domain-containing protein